MLVLSRKAKQSIRIGKDVVITITEIRGNVVRIGIQAPNSEKVMRTELLKEAA